ncbi:hypothetical protein K1719_016254 [Acacia pycnantha]|nr:hypothetical protein K1719_016254 [Acacia pycnantha]
MFLASSKTQSTASSFADPPPIGSPFIPALLTGSLHLPHLPMVSLTMPRRNSRPPIVLLQTYRILRQHLIVILRTLRMRKDEDVHSFTNCI